MDGIGSLLGVGALFALFIIGGGMLVAIDELVGGILKDWKSGRRAREMRARNQAYGNTVASVALPPKKCHECGSTARLYEGYDICEPCLNETIEECVG